MSLGAKTVRSSAVLAVATLVVNGLAFLKMTLSTKYFGTSAAMDAFNLAIVLPILLGTMLGGALQASLVPVLVRKFQSNEDTQPRQIFLSVTIWMVFVCALLGLLLILSGGILLRVIGSGLDATHYRLAQYMLSRAVILLLLQGLVGVGSCFLLAREHFAWLGYLPACSSALTIFLLLTLHRLGTPVLLYGLVAGTFVQLTLVYGVILLRWPGNWNLGGIERLRLRESLGATFLPLFLASSFGLTNSLVDQSFASPLGVGNVTALSIAGALNGVILQVTIFACASVFLPTFSRLIAQREFRALRGLIRQLIDAGLVVFLPLTAFVILLGPLVIRAVLERGAFDATSVQLTSRAWIGYSISLAPYFVGIMMTRIYHSLQKTKVLLWCGVLSVILNALLDYLLGRIWGVLGIALSTSTVFIVVSAILLWGIRQEIGLEAPRHHLRTLAKVLVACGMCVLAIKGYVAWAQPGDGTKLTLFAHALAAAGLGAGLYVLLGWVLRFPISFQFRLATVRHTTEDADG